MDREKAMRWPTVGRPAWSVTMIEPVRSGDHSVLIPWAVQCLWWKRRQLTMRRIPMPIHDWTRVDAGIFHDFHLTWLGTLKTTLNSGLLPAGYYALAEQIAGRIGPDVLTLQSPQPSEGGPSGDTAGAVAVAAAPPKVR